MIAVDKYISIIVHVNGGGGSSYGQHGYAKNFVEVNHNLTHKPVIAGTVMYYQEFANRFVYILLVLVNCSSPIAKRKKYYYPQKKHSCTRY